MAGKGLRGDTSPNADQEEELESRDPRSAGQEQPPARENSGKPCGHQGPHVLFLLSTQSEGDQEALTEHRVCTDLHPLLLGSPRPFTLSFWDLCLPSSPPTVPQHMVTTGTTSSYLKTAPLWPLLIGLEVNTSPSWTNQSLGPWRLGRLD